MDGPPPATVRRAATLASRRTFRAHTWASSPARAGGSGVDDEVELYKDDDGLAVVGTPTAVERFVASLGLATIGSPRAGAVFSAAASPAQAGSEIAANAGRWVKLTEESARKVKEIGWTPTKTRGVSHAMLGKRGDIKNWAQIVTSPGALVTNPAVLSGVAGIMSQRAMQQQMDEIVDYLETIDAKLDTVLRSQTNHVLARLDGVNLAVREAMSIREAVGRVSEVTWSKVQGFGAGDPRDPRLRVATAQRSRRQDRGEEEHRRSPRNREGREGRRAEVARRPGSVLRAA